MVRNEHDELKAHLREQIDFLLSSSKAYDAGFESEAKRLAAALRILLHDTEQSMSLLKQMKKKDSMLYYDTALEYLPNNLAPTLGLLLMKIKNDGKASKASYEPPLDNGPPSRYERGRVPFKEWWNKIVFDDKKGSILTRKDIVLAVANKDGGAHVDTRLNHAYENISRHGSLGYKFIVDGEERKMSTKPELASIRQIAHEVLKSLKDEFPECFH